MGHKGPRASVSAVEPVPMGGFVCGGADAQVGVGTDGTRVSAGREISSPFRRLEAQNLFGLRVEVANLRAKKHRLKSIDGTDYGAVDGDIENAIDTSNEEDFSYQLLDSPKKKVHAAGKR